MLDEVQLEQFYSDDLTDSQIAHFQAFRQKHLPNSTGKVVDVGGGCGHFARQLKGPVRVIDLDPVAIATCHANGLRDSEIGDALNPKIHDDDQIVTFNLVLHHLVNASELTTRELQKRALVVWRAKADYIFVNEYVYDSWIWHDFSGRLIYIITKSATLSALARIIGRVIPDLRANTLGTGVRFRSDKSWRRLFREAGFEVVDYARGRLDGWPLVRALLLLKYSHRDSYLLRAI